MAYDSSSTHPNRLVAELLPTGRPADATAEQLERVLVTTSSDISGFVLPNTFIIKVANSAGGYTEYVFDADAVSTWSTVIADGAGRLFAYAATVQSIDPITGAATLTLTASGEVHVEGSSSVTFNASGATRVTGTSSLTFTTTHGRHLATITFDASGQITGITGAASLSMNATGNVRITGTSSISFTTEQGGGAFSSAFGAAFDGGSSKSTGKAFSSAFSNAFNSSNS